MKKEEQTIVKKSFFKCTKTDIEADTFEDLVKKFQKEIIKLRKELEHYNLQNEKDKIVINIIDLYNIGADTPSEVLEALNSIPMAEAQKYVNFYNKDCNTTKLIFCEHSLKWRYIDTGY